MKQLFSSPRVWLRIFVIVVLALLVLGPVKRVRDLAAVQNAVQRDWEISFGYSDGVDKPAILPERFDAAAYDFFYRRFGDSRGYDGSRPAKMCNRNIVYHERFRALFRGPVHDVHVYDFEEFRGDLGAALVRLRGLRRVTAWALDGGNRPTESEWTRLCTHLRKLPYLEELEVGGAQITDRAIAPLAGHPQLRSLSIIGGRLTESSTNTFVTLPRLTKLHLEEQLHDGDAWLSPAQRATMSAALPNIEIDFP